MKIHERDDLMSFSPIGLRRLSAVLALSATAALSLLVVTQAAQAQAYTVVHEFAGFPNDGRMPTAPVIEDSAGNLYGTTYAAGKLGGGIVVKFNPDGHETILHNFYAGKYGVNSEGLVQDAAGNLYGTTASGGDLSCPLTSAGCGTVFMLDTSNRLTVLHRFHYSDGALPNSGLILDAEGNLYGTTGLGGQANNGTVFKIGTATGHLTVLKSFPNQFGLPKGNIAMDVDGNLYGAALYGGDSQCQCGGVFKLLSGGELEIIFGFTGPNGATPLGGVVIDTEGSLYGTTSAGGNKSCSGGQGCGVVFKLVPYFSETTLYAFTGLADGANPHAGVILDSTGNLYGTTAFGGKATTAGAGYGVAFKLDTSGTETVLHTFSGADGAQPEANLLLDSSGNLYGTTAYGGPTACKTGCGVVFKIAP